MNPTIIQKKALRGHCGLPELGAAGLSKCMSVSHRDVSAESKNLQLGEIKKSIRRYERNFLSFSRTGYLPQINLFYFNTSMTVCSI